MRIPFDEFRYVTWVFGRSLSSEIQDVRMILVKIVRVCLCDRITVRVYFHFSKENSK